MACQNDFDEGKSGINEYIVYILIIIFWRHLFSKQSSSERETLYQLKNLVNRSGVPTDPGDNMKAAEDFLLVVLHSYVIAAANTILAGAEANDLASLSKSIVDHYVLLKALLPVCMK